MFFIVELETAIFFIISLLGFPLINYDVETEDTQQEAKCWWTSGLCLENKKHFCVSVLLSVCLSSLILNVLEVKKLNWLCETLMVSVSCI